MPVTKLPRPGTVQPIFTLALAIAWIAGCAPAGRYAEAAPTAGPPERSGTKSGPGVTEVAVLGMIHGGHRSSVKWGLDALRETIRSFGPDVVCAEIPPDRWERIWRDFSERGVIEDNRVKLFPEYTDVLLPLKREMGFDVEPCAAWTQEMSDLRNERIRRFETDPEQAARRAEYESALEAVRARHEAEPIDEDDPRVIHSETYDARTKEELAIYDEFLNDWIGPGGWTNINEAHYALIDAAIRRNRGRRILITFGAGHKYWFLEQLRARQDIRLLDIVPYLPSDGATEEAGKSLQRAGGDSR